MFDVDHLKNFSQCFGVNPILNYANNVTKFGMITNSYSSQPQQSSTNQCPVTQVKHNVRHGSTTSTPILPSENVPITTNTTTLNNQISKPQSNIRQPLQMSQISSQPTAKNTNQQHNLMTTMITPVNQVLLESTMGDVIGIDSSDCCFTG